MSNSLLTPTVIAKEGLMLLRNNLVMGDLVHREYVNEFKKVGSTIEIRKPVSFVAQSGATRVNQDVTEGYTTLVVDDRWHVSWLFTTQDLTLTIDDYSDRYIEPAAVELANKVDSRIMSVYSDIYWSEGTPGTTPNQFSYLGDIAGTLDLAAVPDDGKRNLVFSPRAKWGMVDALKGLFDSNMPRELVRKGKLGMLANMMIAGDQNIPVHTTGADINAGTLLITTTVSDSYSASTETSTIAIDGFSSAAPAIAVGDVFTVANVYAVNPRSRASTGQLQKFTVTAIAVAGAGNQISLTCRPRVITSGAYQTVNRAVTDGDAVTFLGNASTSYPQNLAFHRNAIAAVFMPLELPRAAGFKARSTMEGVSLRVIEAYDHDNDEEVVRMDVLFAKKAIHPRLAGRLWG